MSDEPEKAPPPSRRPSAIAGAAAARRRTLTRVLRFVAWAITCAALLAITFWAYRRFILLHPNPEMSFSYQGANYKLLDPRILGVVMVLPWFVAILPKSLADLPWPQRILSLLLRFAFIVVLALGLARLARTATTEKACTVYVVDVSNSVPDEALADATAAVERAIKEKPAEGQVKLITFAKRPRLVEIKEDGAFTIERHGDPNASGDPKNEGSGSNLQAALQLAYGLYPPGYLKRAVVLSDGSETDGDLLAEASRARAFGIRLFTTPYTRPTPPEVAVQELKLPDVVKVGETFEAKAKIYSSRATTARARLWQDELLNGLEGVRKIDLKAGPNEVVFKSVVRVAGPMSYSFELDEIGADRFTGNNRVETAVDIPGRPRVLYIEGTPQHATPLANALTAQQFDVEVRPPVGFPGSIGEIQPYDFVIVSDVAKEQLELAAQDLIERYVRDLGGGFLFAGGEVGYGLGGWQRSTMERILPVRMDSSKKEEIPSVALSLVIDRSGSMTGLPMEMAKEAAKATVATLGPNDLIEVIAFDSSPTRYVKLQPARNRTRINADIARIQPGGGTEIFSALDASFQDMTVAQARRKHVILLTDGRAPTGGIKELVQGMAAETITVSSVGLGGDLDEQLLRMIAEIGGGRFHSVPDANNLPKIFTKETELIAQNAAVESWFPVKQTGDAQFIRGIAVGTAPYLHGYVATEMKPPPAEELLVNEDTGEPILARWHVGLGWSLAWTSDVKARWAVEWMKWPGWEQFWGQLVREHMRQKTTRELDMKADVVGGVLHASIDAFTLDERFENGMKSKLSVIGPDPSGCDPIRQKKKTTCKTQTVDFQQTAPGRYEVVLPMDQYGSFLLRADHVREQPDGTSKVVAVSYGHVSNPYPREYATFEPDKAMLASVAVAGGGVFDPATIAEIFDPNGEKITFHEDLWGNFIYLAMALLLLDLLVRRVRLFDRKFVAKARKAY
ncbi:MAG: VWA domain-containing protein [Polyangiaceae bacterium]|nr:VWA domain-containing protein [Polyangiaceae bacterium]